MFEKVEPAEEEIRRSPVSGCKEKPGPRRGGLEEGFSVLLKPWTLLAPRSTSSGRCMSPLRGQVFKAAHSSVCARKYCRHAHRRSLLHGRSSRRWQGLWAHEAESLDRALGHQLHTRRGNHPLIGRMPRRTQDALEPTLAIWHAPTIGKGG